MILLIRQQWESAQDPVSPARFGFKRDKLSRLDLLLQILDVLLDLRCCM